MATERKAPARYRTQGTVQSCSLFTLSKAFDEQEKSPVLVRRFATELYVDDFGWQQFRQTLQQFSQVAVSGLLPVRQIGGQLRQPWLTLGGTEGITLRDRLTAESPSRLLGWLESVANTLTELHASGHVHGRVQSDSIFFSQDNRACLDEIASTHALCAWDIRHHDLPQNLIGELFSSAYLAPEVRNGGEVTPQSDQYSLAIVLVECLTGQSLDVVNIIGCQGCETALAYLAAEAPKARRAVIELLRPVLTRALADDPQQRFPTCRDFLTAVRQAKLEKSHRRRLRVAAMAALVVVSLALFGGKRELDRRNVLKEQARLNESAKEQTRVSEHKDSIRQKIAQKYQSGFPKSKLVNLTTATEFVELMSTPESTEFVDGLLDQQGTSSEFSSRKIPTILTKPLSQGSSPTVTLTFDSASTSSATAMATQTPAATVSGEQSEFFLFSEAGQVARLGSPPKITWVVRIALSSSVRPRGGEFLKVTLEDDNGNVVIEKQVAPATSSSNTYLNGTIEPSNLKLGDPLRAKVWLLENGKQIEWPQSKSWRVGEIRRRTKTIEVTPSAVESSNYSMKSGIIAEGGDRLTIKASGKMTLGTLGVYKDDLGLGQALSIPPTGLLPAKDSSFRIKSVSGGITHPYGALLIRSEQEGGWQKANLSTSTVVNGAGELFLSLNGVSSVKETVNKKTKWNKAPAKYWLGDGAFSVTLALESFIFPPNTSDSTKQQVRRNFSF